MRHRKPELLCPAGDFEAMRAAVANGTDAVYFGLPAFNARHRAINFSLESLDETMRYLHRHNVKGFVTFNVLIFSDELEEAVEYLRNIAQAGVDAIIVQDLGLARLAQRLIPDLHVHASTQMTLTELRGIELVESLGVKRVVLAREMSIEEISKVTRGTTTPVEVFVHGALCVAYSGQCLTSESFGGRSANRGQCAQACRMPYELIVDGAKRDLGDVRYLVSPTDLGSWDIVDRLIEAGISSFKIEGRLKGANYVAATAQTYRGAIDNVLGLEKRTASLPSSDDLTVIYSRGFTHGFLGGVNHQRLVPGRFPKARGRRIGVVSEISRDAFFIDVDDDVEPGFLRPGDGVVFDEGHPESDEAHGQIYKIDEVRSRSRANRLRIELGNNEARPDEVPIGAIVWKTSDPQLNKRLEQTYARDRVVHRDPIDMALHAHVGKHPSLTLTDGLHAVEVEYPQSLERAKKYPISENFALRALDRFLDTPFELRDFTLDSIGDPMIPSSILSDLRRRATDELIEVRHRSSITKIADKNALENLRCEILNSKLQIQDALTPTLSHGVPREREKVHVLARTLDQVDALIDLPDDLRPSTIYCDFEDVRRYRLAVERVRPTNIPIGLATMRIIKPGEEGWLNQVLLADPDLILVRNLAGIGFYREKSPHIALVGDFSLNIANELTAKVFSDWGLIRIVPSYDLSWTQMSAMIRRSQSTFECVIHQHMPMFHMEHCVFAHTLSDGKDFRDCGRPCETHRVDLADKLGHSHPLIPDAGCRNTLFNAQAQSAMIYIQRMIEAGVGDFRIELLRQSGDEIESLIRQYRDVIDGKTAPKTASRSLRVVSQLGVTAGTLDRD